MDINIASISIIKCYRCFLLITIFGNGDEFERIESNKCTTGHSRWDIVLDWTENCVDLDGIREWWGGNTVRFRPSLWFSTILSPQHAMTGDNIVVESNSKCWKFVTFFRIRRHSLINSLDVHSTKLCFHIIWIFWGLVYRLWQVLRTHGVIHPC